MSYQREDVDWMEERGRLPTEAIAVETWFTVSAFVPVKGGIFARANLLAENNCARATLQPSTGTKALTVNHVSTAIGSVGSNLLSPSKATSSL